MTMIWVLKMNYSEVMLQIKKGQIQPISLLYGEETFLIRQIENAIVNSVLLPEEKDMNLIVLNNDPSPKDMANLIETVPFMGGKNVIVVRGTALFKARKGSNEEGESLVESDEQLVKIFSSMPEYSCIVFSTVEKVDKRRKIFKAVEKNGVTVEIAPLKANDVRVWLNTKLAEINKKMSADAVEHLMGAVSVMPQISLGFLDNELEKLALYAKGSLITFEDLSQVLSTIPEVSVFAMIDALSQKQAAKALGLLNGQLATGDHPLRIMALLARQVRLLWQAKELASQGYDGRSAALALGVPPFIGEKMLRQSKNFSTSTLKKGLLDLAAADYEFKAGRADSVILEKLIIDMCRQ